MAKRKNKISKREKTTENQLKSRGQEKQVRVIFVSMICLILTIFLIYLLVESSKKFEYLDIKFEKVKKGDLNLYNAKLPLRDINDQITGYQGFYFREDPRKLDYIDIDGHIELTQSAAALAADSDVSVCEDGVLAASTLALFLQLADVSSFGATTSKTESIRYGRTYVNCGDENTVLLNNYMIIEFKEGNSTRIERVNNGCYKIYVDNCNIMNATERFMMGIYAHARDVEI